MNRIHPFIFAIAMLMFTSDTFLHADEKAERQQVFLRFITLFDAAKNPDEFRESAKVLESMVADGVSNGAIFYNLGNAYYRAGEFGRAILNYRKAKPYRPRDTLLEANLQQALLASPGKLPEAARPWWLHVMFWTEVLSYPNRVLIALGFFALAPVVALASVLLRHRSWMFLAGGFVAIGSMFALDITLNSPDRALQTRAVIIGETVARKGIGKNYEAAFDSPLKDGAEFDILQEANGWTFGHFNGIGDGWVSNEFVAR